MEDIKKTVKETVFKEEKKEKLKSSKKYKGIRISGIKSDYLLFRFGKDVKRVPVSEWKGGDEQEFTEAQYKEFSKN